MTARRPILPPPVLPEVDHLLEKRLGRESGIPFHAGIARRQHIVAHLPRRACARAVEIDEPFDPLSLGFVDAAIVALTAVLDVRRVETPGRRHFTRLAARFPLDPLP